MNADALRALARDARDACETTDCYDCSVQLKEILISEHGVAPDRLTINEYTIDGYRHYTLIIDSRVWGTEFLVDPTIDQFAHERDAPVTVASASTIDPVVVVTPPARYVFHEYRS